MKEIKRSAQERRSQKPLEVYHEMTMEERIAQEPLHIKVLFFVPWGILGFTMGWIA